MKNLSFLNVLLLALAIFGLSSCGSDDTTIELGPEASFAAVDGFLSTDSTATAGGTFQVRLVAEKGDTDLSSLEIYEDATKLDDTRVSVDGISIYQAVQAVSGDDVSGFTWDITVTAHTDLADTPYDFVVTDKGGKSTTATIYINTDNSSATPLTITLNNTDPITLTTGIFNFSVNASGPADLVSIAVMKGGALMDASDLRYETFAFDANPQTLTGDDVNGLVSEAIGVNITSAGVYTFEVTDANGTTASADITVLTGTDIPASDIFSAILVYNNSGPNFGGLDLDSGMSVSSGNADADLIDEGNQGAGNQDWLKQIRPNGGAVLREIPDDNSDLYNFNAMSTKEAVVAAYDNGTEQSSTDVLNIGDVFTVKNGDDYYILQIGDITVTSADNLDSYEINIKRANF